MDFAWILLNFHDVEFFLCKLQELTILIYNEDVPPIETTQTKKSTQTNRVPTPTQ